MGKRKRNEAIAYRRVSTEKQGESGVGFEGQDAAIRTYASLDGIQIVGEFSDVASGRGKHNRIQRPGLQRALELAKATGQPIIVSGLDRISREAATVDQIVRELGVTIISAGDGKLRNPVIIASEAARRQREGELIAQRTKDALARRKAEGVRLGNTTNLEEAQRKGVEKKKQIAADKVQEIVRVLKELGETSLTDRQLVDELNKREILTGSKRSWTIPGVRRPARAARKMIEEHKRSLETHKKNPLFGRFG